MKSTIAISHTTLTSGLASTCQTDSFIQKSETIAWSKTGTLVAVCACLLASGCASNGNSLLGVSKRMETAERVSLTGANPIFDSENFEEVNLEVMLDPRDYRNDESLYKPRLICKKYVTETEAKAKAKAKYEHGHDVRTGCINRAYLAASLAAFYDPRYGAAKDRRNRVQDRLLAASEHRCGAYKQYLKAYDIHWETGLGIGTTVLAAAGAIATGTLNTRAFSGLAAMFSGTRAEIRQGVFSNLASFVIIPGIDKKRTTLLEAIKENRKLDISEYTVEAALHDAAAYHGACTLESGLEVAQDSIKRIENPGLSQINKTLAHLAETKQLMNMVSLANSNTLTADKAKVIAVEYAIKDVVLAGGGKPKPPSNDERIKLAADDTLNAFLAIRKTAAKLKATLEAAEAVAPDADKKKIKESILTLEKYFAPPAKDGTNPKNTFPSVQTELANKLGALAKNTADAASAIRADQIKLGGEKDPIKVIDGQASFAVRTAALTVYVTVALESIQSKTSASFQELLRLFDPNQKGNIEFTNADVEFMLLADLVVPTIPASISK